MINEQRIIWFINPSNLERAKMMSRVVLNFEWPNTTVPPPNFNVPPPGFGKVFL